MRHFLVWNEVGSEEWQAGSAVRYYSIMKEENGRYSVSSWRHERLRRIAMTDTLAQAKAVAKRDFDFIAVLDRP